MKSIFIYFWGPGSGVLGSGLLGSWGPANRTCPDGHMVCSAHFVDGTKMYMNNAPLIEPKTVKPVQSKACQALA